MKSQRQDAILNIINNNDVETQEDLMFLLEEEGFKVTQATISRDIRELKITKISTEFGGQKYSAIHQNNQDKRDISEKYRRIFHDALVSVETAQNILVLKTVAGMAMAVAAAVDSMHFEGVVGCIAGDDTVFCAVKTVEDTSAVAERIHKLTSGHKV